MQVINTILTVKFCHMTAWQEYDKVTGRDSTPPLSIKEDTLFY